MTAQGTEQTNVRTFRDAKTLATKKDDVQRLVTIEESYQKEMIDQIDTEPTGEKFE